MKRRAIVAVTLFLLMHIGPVDAVQSGPAAALDMVRTVVEKQKDRPFWFLPFTPVLPGISFAYEAASTFTVQREGDAELKMSANAKQQIVLGEGWEQVRTIFIGTSASGRDHNTLTGIRSILFNRYRQHLATLDKQRLSDSRAQGTEGRRRMWEEFLRAFRFERMANRMRDGRTAAVVLFTPRRGYAPNGAVDAEIFPNIKGELWIDESDLEIVRLSYEFVADSPEFMSLGPVRRKTRYSMDLTESIDGEWLPVRAEAELFRRNGSSESHDSYSVEFSRYRKFDVNAKINVLGQEPLEKEEP